MKLHIQFYLNKQVTICWTINFTNFVGLGLDRILKLIYRLGFRAHKIQSAHLWYRDQNCVYVLLCIVLLAMRMVADVTKTCNVILKLAIQNLN